MKTQHVSDSTSSIRITTKVFGLLALVAALMVFAGNAHAMIEPAGTFVPSRCGQQQDVRVATFDVSVRQACVGQIVGETGKKAVSFKMSDESVKVFRIAQTSNELEFSMSGNVKSVFQLVNDVGDHATMKVIASSTGDILSATGHVGSATYFVPSFENVFVIQ